LVLRVTACAFTGQEWKAALEGSTRMFASCVLCCPSSLALMFIYSRYKSKADNAADVTVNNHKLQPLHVGILFA
jgi:hypothetical protein